MDWKQYRGLLQNEIRPVAQHLERPVGFYSATALRVVQKKTACLKILTSMVSRQFLQLFVPICDIFSNYISSAYLMLSFGFWKDWQTCKCGRPLREHATDRHSKQVFGAWGMTSLALKVLIIHERYCLSSPMKGPLKNVSDLQGRAKVALMSRPCARVRFDGICHHLSNSVKTEIGFKIRLP